MWEERIISLVSDQDSKEGKIAYKINIHLQYFTSSGSCKIKYLPSLRNLSTGFGYRDILGEVLAVSRQWDHDSIICFTIVDWPL